MAGLLLLATPASAICFTPTNYSGDAFEKISGAIEYTVCLIGDHATIINQHADIIEDIKSDIVTLRMDIMDVSDGQVIGDGGAVGDLQYLTVSNAQKINSVEQKLDAIIARLDALENAR